MAASREKLLLEKGAQWRPDKPREIQWVRRNLLECEPDVTVELIEQLMKQTVCTHDAIHDLLRTPAMKKHLTPVARKFGLMGFDIRTKEQKAEDERRAARTRLLGHEGGRQAYSKTTSTSGLVHAKAKTRLNGIARMASVATRFQFRLHDGLEQS